MTGFGLGVLAANRRRGGGGGGGPTSTKWRLYIWEKQTTTDFAALAEVEFRATAGGSDQATGGTASASSANQPASQAFDNSNASSWQAGAATVPQWLEYDFASAVGVEQVLMRAAPANGPYTPTAISVQYWDGSAWQTYWSFVTDGTWTAGEARTFTRAAPDLTTPCRYWRLVCADANDPTSLLFREVEMHTTHGGADVTGSGTAFGDPGGFSGTEGPDKAFNNSTADWWQPIPASHGKLVYLGYDFGSGNDKLINEVVCSPHPSFLARSPSIIVVQKSADNVTYSDVALFFGMTTWSGDRPLSW